MVRSPDAKCSGCQAGDALDVYPGFFRDIDVEMGGPGIPVCPGCGGIGWIVDSPDFKQRSHELSRLRWDFFAAKGPMRAPILRRLIEAVKEQFRRYGQEGDESFAARVATGSLDGELERLERLN